MKLYNNSTSSNSEYENHLITQQKQQQQQQQVATTNNKNYNHHFQAQIDTMKNSDLDSKTSTAPSMTVHQNYLIQQQSQIFSPSFNHYPHEQQQQQQQQAIITTSRQQQQQHQWNSQQQLLAGYMHNKTSPLISQSKLQQPQSFSFKTPPLFANQNTSSSKKSEEHEVLLHKVQNFNQQNNEIRFYNEPMRRLNSSGRIEQQQTVPATLSQASRKLSTASMGRSNSLTSKIEPPFLQKFKYNEDDQTEERCIRNSLQQIKQPFNVADDGNNSYSEYEDDEYDDGEDAYEDDDYYDSEDDARGGDSKSFSIDGKLKPNMNNNSKQYNDSNYIMANNGSLKSQIGGYNSGNESEYLMNQSSDDSKQNRKRHKGELICQVCGANANGYNFDAITCESCKAFFRRNAFRPSNEFRCINNGNCVITINTRKKCKKCRIDKCFQVCMKKEWIMSETEREEKRRKIEENRRKKANKMHLQLQIPHPCSSDLIFNAGLTEKVFLKKSIFFFKYI